MKVLDTILASKFMSRQVNLVWKDLSEVLEQSAIGRRSLVSYIQFSGGKHLGRLDLKDNTYELVR